DDKGYATSHLPAVPPHNRPPPARILSRKKRVATERKEDSNMSRSVNLVLCTVWFLVPIAAWGQGANASISGTVQDPTGAAVPNADLTLRAIGVESETKTTSDASGLYTFPNLRPGVYDLVVSAKGFRDFAQNGVSLNIDSKAR